MSLETTPAVVTPIPNGFKVTFRGNVQSQPEFLQAEMDRVVKAKPTLVQFDLMAVDYIASAGLGILVAFRNRIIEAGGVVKTVAVHPRVREVLKMSGLLKVFNVE